MATGHQRHLTMKIPISPIFCFWLVNSIEANKLVNNIEIFSAYESRLSNNLNE